MHTATISTADKGNHALLSCEPEDESRANPVVPGESTNTSSDVEIRGVVTVPTTIEHKAQCRVSTGRLRRRMCC